MVEGKTQIVREKIGDSIGKGERNMRKYKVKGLLREIEQER